jgi:hypothetical protein
MCLVLFLPGSKTFGPIVVFREWDFFRYLTSLSSFFLKKKKLNNFMGRAWFKWIIFWQRAFFGFCVYFSPLLLLLKVLNANQRWISSRKVKEGSAFLFASLSRFTGSFFFLFLHDEKLIIIDQSLLALRLDFFIPFTFLAMTRPPYGLLSWRFSILSFSFHVVDSTSTLF